MKKMSPFFITLIFLLLTNSVISQGIVINEILTSNTTVNKDEDGTYQDWIELFNSGSTAVSLTSYGLSDDALLPFKWTFPNITITPGQYLLIWCSDKNRTDPANPLHTNFKLSSAGDLIVLTNTSGTVVDSVPATALLQNVSYGRLPNGTGPFVFFSTVTPAAINASVGYNETLAPPTFSQDSGFFTTGFNLTLSSTVPGSTILYTLDGSEPKESNLGGTTYSYKNQYSELVGQATGPLLTNSFKTLQYSSPISIIDRSSQPNKLANISTTYNYNPYVDNVNYTGYFPTGPIYKATVVRAKLIKPGALESKTVSKTYNVSPLGSSRFSLPVISISLDENKLFDYNEGIDVAGVDYDNWRIANPNDEYPSIGNVANFFRSGMPYERVANMTYFVNGAEVLNQDIGVRIHGGSSRVAQNRSLTFYARSDYGKSAMNYQFFPDRVFDSYTGVLLHHSGNDYNQTLFRDALCHSLVKSLNILTKGYQPTILLIDGEYWGIMSLRDKIDADYFVRTFNIAKTQVDVLEDGYSLDHTLAGDNSDYLTMISYLETHPLSTQANFDYIQTRLDPDNLKDYFISEIFLDNSDWPSNNIVFWRKKTTGYEPNASYGQDGRWRWMFHDLDDTFAISHPKDVNRNSLAIATDPVGTDYPNPLWATLVLRRMLENETFKNEFITRFADLLNTTFKSTRVLTRMAEMKAVLAPEMPEQYARWKAPWNNGDWNYFLDNEINFATQRPAFQRDHIRAKFGITSNINATLDVSNPSHGYIKMNTIDVKVGTDGITSNPYPWTGIYFSNIPVKMKAIANPGFVFSHWTGASTSTNPEITLTSTADFSVTAVFVPETVATSQPIYYWFMNSTIANNLPLETLNTTYKAGPVDAKIQYQSCLVGYPFTSTDPNWRKASMERRNSPTVLNYIPELNNNLPFLTSDMKGLQIKEPLQNGGLENTMVFTISASGYKNIKFSFAAINELTNATAIAIDYSINDGTPVWITSGLTNTSLPFASGYQLFNVDFSSITAVNNNANFKIRLRFTGTNMTADTGARITFNNIAVYGAQVPLAVTENNNTKFSVFPNPFVNEINILGLNDTTSSSYKLFTIDGKLIKNGVLENSQIQLNDLSKGIYLLELSSNGKLETKKVIKR